MQTQALAQAFERDRVALGAEHHHRDVPRQDVDDRERRDGDDDQRDDDGEHAA